MLAMPVTSFCYVPLQDEWTGLGHMFDHRNGKDDKIFKVSYIRVNIKI